MEEGDIDIVRILDVYQASGYLYCTLYFFTRNKIATVNQILNPDDYGIWRVMDNEEYDERMSMRFWQKVDRMMIFEISLNNPLIFCRVFQIKLIPRN